jgi:hypothetical protein
VSRIPLPRRQEPGYPFAIPLRTETCARFIRLLSTKYRNAPLRASGDKYAAISSS